MGLFGFFRPKSDVERLEQEAAANPTAASLTALAERYQAAGNIAQALAAEALTRTSTVMVISRSRPHQRRPRRSRGTGSC